MNVNNPRPYKYATFKVPLVFPNGVLIELNKIQDDPNYWLGKISVLNDVKIEKFSKIHMYDLRYTLEPSKSSF